MSKLKKIGSVSLFASFVFVVGYYTTYAKTIDELIDYVTDTLASSVVKLIFALALLFFFWGVVQYTIMPGEEAKDKGRGYMTWGLIALTIMFMVYGVINIITTSFGLDEDNSTGSIPDLPN